MRLKNTHFMSTGIKATLLATMCFSPFTFASDAKVDEQFEVGKEKAKVCMTCHGADGISTIDAIQTYAARKKVT